MTSPSLENITVYWNGVLANPALAQAWSEYDTLKGDHGHKHNDDEKSPTERVREGLASLSGNEAGQITPEEAQKLQFLQQFAKTEIRALDKSYVPLVRPLNQLSAPLIQRLDKSSLPVLRMLVKLSLFLLMDDPDKKNQIDELKKRLADIESVLPPEDMERLATVARNSQRHPSKKRSSLDGYKNWLDGTLTEDQSAVIEALQWKTASGRFQPVKTVVNILDHFFEEHLVGWKNQLATVAITKLVYDSIVFMTSVAGPHQTIKDAAKDAYETLVQTSGQILSTEDNLLAAFEQLSEGQAAAKLGESAGNNVEEILDVRCMDKVDADWSSVDFFMDHTPLGSYCHEISQGLQTWFALATVTPRTIQAGQKEISEGILAEGTVMAESYNRHHEEVSAAIDVAAYYDNTLHAVLLGIGAAHGVKLVKKHGVRKAPVHMYESLKQQGHLVLKRPLTAGGALAGWGTFAATHQGEFFDLSAVSYALAGALLGYLAQRSKIHLADNKTFIFNLHAQSPHSEVTYVPPTSLDQKQRRYFLKAAASYVGLTAVAIMANNAGVLNHQSPEAVKFVADLIMGEWAWKGGVGSWLVFDKFDDSLYHKIFYATGVIKGAIAAIGAVGIGTAASAVLCRVPGAPYIQAAWGRAVEVGKKKAAVITLAAGLTIAPANSSSFEQERDLLFIPSRSPEISNTEDFEPKLL